MAGKRARSEGDCEGARRDEPTRVLLLIINDENMPVMWSAFDEAKARDTTLTVKGADMTLERVLALWAKDGVSAIGSAHHWFFDAESDDPNFIKLQDCSINLQSIDQEYTFVSTLRLDPSKFVITALYTVFGME